MTNHANIITDHMPNLIDGDWAEFGCFNGGFTKVMASYGHRVWAFDTFTGIPKEDYGGEIDKENEPGKFVPEHDVLGFLATIPNIIVKQGRFVDTLPTIPKDTIFSVVYLDCDYYASYTQVLLYLELHKHIRPGTLMIFDDYTSCKGARLAVDAWKRDRKLDPGNRFLIY